MRLRFADALDAIVRTRARSPRPQMRRRGVLLVSIGGLGDTILFSVVAPRFLKLAEADEPVDLIVRSDAAAAGFLYPPRMRVRAVDYRRFSRNPFYRLRTSLDVSRATYRRAAFDRPFAPTRRGRRAGRGLGRGRALRHDAPMLAQARRQAGPQPAALLGLVRHRRRHGAPDGALDRLRQLGDGAERSDAGGSLRSGALAGAGPLRGADRGRARLFRDPRAPPTLSTACRTILGSRRTTCGSSITTCHVAVASDPASTRSRTRCTLAWRASTRTPSWTPWQR